MATSTCNACSYILFIPYEFWDMISIKLRSFLWQLGPLPFFQMGSLIARELDINALVSMLSDIDSLFIIPGIILTSLRAFYNYVFFRLWKTSLVLTAMSLMIIYKPSRIVLLNGKSPDYSDRSLICISRSFTNLQSASCQLELCEWKLTLSRIHKPMERLDALTSFIAKFHPRKISV